MSGITALKFWITLLMSSLLLLNSCSKKDSIQPQVKSQTTQKSKEKETKQEETSSSDGTKPGKSEDGKNSVSGQTKPDEVTTPNKSDNNDKVSTSDQTDPDDATTSNNPEEDENQGQDQEEDTTTPETPAPNGGDYSARARAGQTWWVKGVNEHAPPLQSWKNLAPHMKMLDWDKSYGWYDLNKENPYSGSTVSDLCWAAVSANAIQWWLDQNKDYIERIAYEGPRHFTGPYSSDIFDLYRRHFSNRGGDLKLSMDWFFNGKYARRGYALEDLPGAGFFRPIFGEDFRPVVQIGVSPSSFSDDVAQALKSGESLSCALEYGRGYLHALSIWGADFDATGQVTHIYLTDSNDGYKEYGPPNGLVRKAIQITNEGVYHEGSVQGSFTFKIFHLFKLGLYREKWETYFSTHNGR